MKTAVIDSHLRCPYDGKRLVVEIGQGLDSGEIEIAHLCLHCSYIEHAPRTVAEAKRHSDVPALVTLRQQLDAIRLGGRDVPLVYDDQPFPEVSW